MKKEELAEQVTRLIKDKTTGALTTHSLMELGMTRDEANELLEMLARDGVVRLVPLVSGSN
jgi:predicted site-specific integrase-resolvase